MFTKLMLVAAAAMVLGPVASACDECEKERAQNVSYEDEDDTERVPASFETTAPITEYRTVDTVESDYFNASNRFNYTKPAAGARLQSEEDYKLIRTSSDSDCECER